MGVFPLIFMRGLSGQYIAVANTPEEAQAMEPIANECLEASIGTKPAPRRGTISVFKRADIARSRRWRRVWVQSPQPELLGNHTDPFVHQLPLLAAPILRPGMDLVVLPSSEAVLEHWSFVKQTLGLADNQVLLVATPPNVAADVHAVPRLDDYMDANIIDDLLARLKDSHARANSSVVAAAARQLARKNIESLTPSSSHPTLPDMAARKDAPGTLAAAALEKKMELLPPSSPPGGTHAAPMDFG